MYFYSRNFCGIKFSKIIMDYILKYYNTIVYYNTILLLLYYYNTILYTKYYNTIY